MRAERHDPELVGPYANLKTGTGAVKNHGIRRATGELPGHASRGRAPCSRSGSASGRREVAGGDALRAGGAVGAAAAGRRSRRRSGRGRGGLRRRPPPRTTPDRKAIRQHALRVRLVMAEAATASGAARTVESWLSEASWAAAELGLDQPRSDAYRAALAAASSWREADSG
jgi:hypothetical protein